MKVLTVFGTRPEIIRLSQVMKRLDDLCDHVMVHTGQNYDPNLSDLFFDELGLRQPDYHLGVRAAGFGDQIAGIFESFSKVLEREKPDRLLILGDTNSCLTAVLAARAGIPVYHMEAGNRCFDRRVPEETNRRIIDHCSDILMPYTHRSKENLMNEGIERQRIFVVGNPIFEVLNAYEDRIERSGVFSRLRVEPQGYFLATLHRAENVDGAQRLKDLFSGIVAVAESHHKPVIMSVHPRTADKLKHFHIDMSDKPIIFVPPLGFFDFVKLEKNAFGVLSDSGTVQEECCLFRVPNVTLRDVTERPETVECGSNILSGGDPEGILNAVHIALKSANRWVPPAEYLEREVSVTVSKVVLGFRFEPNDASPGIEARRQAAAHREG